MYIAVAVASAAPVEPSVLLVFALASVPTLMLLFAAVSLQSAWSVSHHDAGSAVGEPLAACSNGSEPQRQLVVALRRDSY